MVKRANHRICSESVAGRRLTSAKGSRVADDSKIPPHTLEHNRAVEAARAAKLAERKARKADTIKLRAADDGSYAVALHSDGSYTDLNTGKHRKL